LYFTEKIWLNQDEVFRICELYERDCFGTTSNTNLIKEYIELYKKELLNKENLSEEDKIIESVINS